MKKEEKDLKSVLREFEDAFIESSEAIKASFDTELRRKKARYRLMEASTALQNAKQDRLQDLVTFHNN